MSEKLLDLDNTVTDYAIEFLTKKQKKQADLKNPTLDYDRLRLVYGKTNYKKVPPLPTSHVLFSANFSNNTPKPQTYALRTERKTKSSCTISFTECFTYGASLQMRLTPLNPVMEANAGFQANMTKTKGISHTFEQELTWSVDNAIVVPPGYQTRADLVIKEESYSGDFNVVTTFEGEILVTFYTKKNKEHIKTVNINVCNEIFDELPGFKRDENSRPTFTVKGICDCKYGVEQNVVLTESVLPPADPSKKSQTDTTS